MNTYEEAILSPLRKERYTKLQNYVDYVRQQNEDTDPKFPAVEYGKTSQPIQQEYEKNDPTAKQMVQQQIEYGEGQTQGDVREKGGPKHEAYQTVRYIQSGTLNHEMRSNMDKPFVDSEYKTRMQQLHVNMDIEPVYRDSQTVQREDKLVREPGESHPLPEVNNTSTVTYEDNHLYANLTALSPSWIALPSVVYYIVNNKMQVW